MHRKSSTILQVCVLLIGAQQLLCGAEPTFYFSPYTINWYEAVEYCNQLGLRLAVVDSAAKHDVASREAEAAYLKQVWLGASDLAQAKSYTWQSTGERVLFTKWNAGEPTGGNEHCLSLNNSPDTVWAWNDLSCDTKLNAVCEINPKRCAWSK